MCNSGSAHRVFAIDCSPHLKPLILAARYCERQDVWHLTSTQSTQACPSKCSHDIISACPILTSSRNIVHLISLLNLPGSPRSFLTSRDWTGRATCSPMLKVGTTKTALASPWPSHCKADPNLASPCLLDLFSLVGASSSQRVPLTPGQRRARAFGAMDTRATDRCNSKHQPNAANKGAPRHNCFSAWNTWGVNYITGRVCVDHMRFSTMVCRFVMPWFLRHPPANIRIY